ncbi:MAG: hypothetical protein EOO06_03465 [Chitinophagaceae bacterium]|nr:MAG: hypothetical protein EOO06_03465 [Chitinophagaceae bacterium]
MKSLFTILGLLSWGFPYAQLRLLEPQNGRSTYFETSLNKPVVLSASGVSQESVYELFPGLEEHKTDSALIRLLTYDSLGQTLQSKAYRDKQEITSRFNSTYSGAKLQRQSLSQVVNGNIFSSFTCVYNAAGLEEYLYIYTPGKPDPAVLKKAYDRQSRLTTIWEADPDSKRFSVVVEYDYLSAGSLRKMHRFPLRSFESLSVDNFRSGRSQPEELTNNDYRGKTFFIRRKTNINETETFHDEGGNELVSYEYDSAGNCLQAKYYVQTLLYNGLMAQLSSYTNILLGEPNSPGVLTAKREYNPDNTVKEVRLTNSEGKLLRTFRHYYKK